jgi:hypothetical protein
VHSPGPGDRGTQVLGSADMAPLPRRSHAAGSDLRTAHRLGRIIHSAPQPVPPHLERDHLHGLDWGPRQQPAPAMPIRLPGLTGGVGVGGDRLLGDSEHGRPTNGRTILAATTRYVHVCCRIRPRCRNPHRDRRRGASGRVPMRATSWCRRDAAAPAVGLTDKRLTCCWCTHGALCFAAVPNAQVASAVCSPAASRGPS